MPTSDGVLTNIDQLLKPISQENPCGEYLRFDPVWSELSDLRKSRTDPIDASRNKVSDWPAVASISCELLTTRTKDLLLAGWLTEALLRTEGFPGLRDGLRVIFGLVEKFWATVYPLLEEGDNSTRTAPLTWLTSEDSGARLWAVVREVPLAPSIDGPVFNWNYWHLRRTLPQSTGEKDDVYRRRVAEAEKKKQTFDSAVEAAPIAYYQTLGEDIDACSFEVDRLSRLLDERLGVDSPSWKSLQSSMSDIRTYIQDVLKRRGSPTTSSLSDEKATEAASAPAASNNSAAVGGPIRSRADALVRLEEIASFFSATEPHSPVTYLVRRSIRWAEMPFFEVLNELVKDEKLIKQIGDTLGIPSGPGK